MTSSTSSRPRLRRWAMAVSLVLTASVVALVAPPAPAGALPGDIGVEGRPFVEVGEPTTSKPESKVWFNDGAWWSVQVVQDGTNMAGNPLGSSYISRLDAATQTWSSTLKIENRATAKADVLSVGNNLYVSTHKTDRNDGVVETITNNKSKLFRYTYSTVTHAYVAVAGYPKVMNDFEMFALTIDRSSSGALWAAWVMGDGSGAPARGVYTQYSTDDGATWSTPTALADPRATASTDDIAGIIAYGTQVGVMWADKVPDNDGFWFAVHDADPAVGAWAPAEAAFTGTGLGDNHLNLKAYNGEVFAAVKTRIDTGTSPLVVLLQRSSTGTWSNRTAWIGTDNVTRPVVQIDATNARASIYATAPLVLGGDGEQGGQIVVKTVPLASGTFAAGVGTPVMKRDPGALINDTTGSKAPYTDATGLVMLASAKNVTPTAKGTYWHSLVPPVVAPTAPAAPAAPTAVGGNAKATVTWVAPANGGSAITGYTITPFVGNTAQAPVAVGPTPTSVVVTGLTNGTAYTFTVSATNAIGSGPASPKSAPVTPMSGGPVGAVYVPVAPCRVVDTRFGGGGKFVGPGTRDYQVAGIGPSFADQGGKSGGCAIPAGATAVEATVTASAVSSSGYFRARAKDTPAADASFLNYTTGVNATNTGAIPIKPGGMLGLTVVNFIGTTHYIIDVQGYFIAPANLPPATVGAVYFPVAPCRVVDTRFGGGGKFVGAGTRDYQVAGSGPSFAPQGGTSGGCAIPAGAIPGGATAVEATVTASAVSSSGYFRARAKDTPAADASFLNYTTGVNATNTGAIPLKPGGTPDLTVVNFIGTTHYIIDVQGYFAPQG